MARMSQVSWHLPITMGFLQQYLACILTERFKLRMKSKFRERPNGSMLLRIEPACNSCLDCANIPHASRMRLFFAMSRRLYGIMYGITCCME